MLATGPAVGAGLRKVEAMMAFGMFSAQSSPIAIDFGSSAVKLLQVGTGEQPPLLAAAELPVPDEVRNDQEKLLEFYGQRLPALLREGRFKGKRAVIAVPSGQTFIQHMQLDEAAGVSRDDAIKTQLMTQMGCSPSGLVIRSVEVCPVHRNGVAKTEIICFAITKDTVMRYVELLKRCKLEVVGVHTEVLATVRAFDHLQRRADDVNTTTLYVDMGWSGTRVAICHGKQLTFARSITIGGKHFDQLIAGTAKCDLPTARAHRISLQAQPSTDALAMQHQSFAGRSMTVAARAADMEGSLPTVGAASAAVATERRVGHVPAELDHQVLPGDGPRSAVNVDLSELLDTITDELSMCLRYHQSLFRGRPIDRTVFLGGESRQSWLCQHIVKELGLAAHMGNPMARFDTANAPSTPGLTLSQPQPGWAVACGLCNAPTDL